MKAKQWQDGLWIGLLLLIIAWLSYLIWGLGDKVSIAFTEAKEVEAQYEALEARRGVLESDLAVLKTERGQEAAIRESFGVAKPGEEVIVVVPPVAATSSPERSWWRRLFGWF